MTILATQSTLNALLWDANAYFVPIYQRNYSWDKEQITRLWETLCTSAADNQDYFLGSVVLVKTESEQIFEVLDGQQRLATLLLLLAAFRKHLTRVAGQPGVDARALIGRALEIVVNGTVPQGIPFHAGMQTHFRLNDQDHAFFAATIAGNSPEPSHASHRLIRKAFNYFDNQIGDKLQAGGWNDAGHLWNSIANALTQHLFYVRITVSNISTAQAVFESLNSAGMDLTKADLIKNYLLMNIPSYQHAVALAEWTNTTSTLGETLDLTTFIRAYWNSRVEFVRTDRLYEELREVVVPNPAAVPAPSTRTGRTPPFQMLPMSFLQELSANATIAYHMASPDSTHWPDAALLRDLEDLRDLGASTVWVPLLAAHVAASQPGSQFTFADVVRRFLSLHVRYIVVGPGTANDVEKKYSEWAVSMRSDPINLAGVMSEVDQITPGDTEFKADMLRFSVKRLKTARVMLARINDQNAPKTGASGGAATPGAIARTIRDGAQIHVEHVIPQEDTQWKTFLSSEQLLHDEVVDRFGNLTLLLGPRNIAISNKPFGDKKSEYVAASGDINFLLSNAAKFGKQELSDRSEQLADWAVLTWPK